MQKIVYELRDNVTYWSVAQFMPYPKSQMHLLFLSFFEKYDWISVDMQEKQVVIWDSFDEKHESWEKISKLYVSKENYDQVVNEWNKNAISPAKYLIIYRDTNRWVYLETKSELSKEDLDAIKEDKEAKLQHEQQG